MTPLADPIAAAAVEERKEPNRISIVAIYLTNQNTFRRVKPTRNSDRHHQRHSLME